jgi:HD superfamily phosphohydrolase
MIIRDAVHGDIYLEEYEEKIIDTPQMQRLRGIKQLGTTFYVFPTALHTRFDHSIGTCWIAKRIILEINNVSKETKFKVSKEIEKEISCAALVHDITHIPFGHTMEDERRVFGRHDKPEEIKKFLEKEEIGDVLEDIGVRDNVIKILQSKDPEKEKYPAPWKVQLISNTICADLLDYLRRDSYFSGLMKNYDDRVFKYLRVMDKKLVLDFVKDNMVRLDARSEIIHVLNLRYFLTERLYLHHAKISAGSMIAKAVEIAVKKYGTEREDFIGLTDEGLINYLKDIPSKRKPDKEITTLLTRVENRNLLKRAYVISPKTISPYAQKDLIHRYHFDNKENRESAEGNIAEKLGIGSEEVIIYCSGGEYLKEAEVNITTPKGIIKLNEPRDNPPSDVKEIMEQYERLWKLYVFVPDKYRNEAGEICEKVIGFDTEYKKFIQPTILQWVEK